MNTETNEQNNNQGVDEAISGPALHTRSGPSMVWLIPLVTLLVGGWLVYQTMAERGPTITVSFKTADGIVPGKTRVRYKNVDVGSVEGLTFSKDFSEVLLTLEISKSGERLIRRDTRFWVVRPRLSLREVSGLGTLISGAYIELDPGQGSAQSHFIGLESPPVLTTDVEGRKVMLIAPGLGSIDVGSPIYFQGIHAGEVLGYELGSDQHSVLIHAFINAPYDGMLKPNSRFWNVSGVDLSLTADGLKVETQSFESILFGGIAFESPATLEPVKGDVDGIVFTLHASRKAIEESTYTEKVQFVLFFDGSVRGLRPGAPVEFYGIRVGTVKDLRLEYTPADNTHRLPVLIELEPQRIVTRGVEAAPGDPVEKLQVLADLVDKGLRARLATGNLLTGQLFVELIMRPDSEIQAPDSEIALPQLPTIPATLDQLAGSVEGILNDLRDVDFKGISDELKGTLAGANALVHSQHIQQALVELEGTLRGSNELANDKGLRDTLVRLDDTVRSLNVILASFEKRSDSLAENTDEALAEGRRALIQARKTMKMIDAILAEDSQLQYNTNRMTSELAETARAIRSFVQYLERNPNAVLFGKQAPSR